MRGRAFGRGQRRTLWRNEHCSAQQVPAESGPTPTDRDSLQDNDSRVQHQGIGDDHRRQEAIYRRAFEVARAGFTDKLAKLIVLRRVPNQTRSHAPAVPLPRSRRPLWGGGMTDSGPPRSHPRAPGRPAPLHTPTSPQGEDPANSRIPRVGERLSRASSSAADERHGVSTVSCNPDVAVRTSVAAQHKASRGHNTVGVCRCWCGVPCVPITSRHVYRGPAGTMR